VHSVKGETHTATLVLDSFFHKHHLDQLRPWLLGKKPLAGKTTINEKVRLSGRLKLHYVAMTRPSHLLCLAMRKDAFAAGEIDKMATSWKIIECADKP
jgi:DNA helicase-2/ATP-dependent DNA helicase PcrA